MFCTIKYQPKKKSKNVPVYEFIKNHNKPEPDSVVNAPGTIYVDAITGKKLNKPVRKGQKRPSDGKKYHVGSKNGKTISYHG